MVLQQQSIDNNQNTDTKTISARYADETYNKKLTNLDEERKGCVKLNLNMLTTCKINKQILDLYYRDLNTDISMIQTSVIFLSTISAFLQALGSKITLDENTVFCITLVVSTYISLILSLSKFFKIDERKETTHNLREKYSSLNNNIRYILDTLKPLNAVGYINPENIDEKIEEWATLSDKIKNDRIQLIETKQQIFMDYDSILDTKQRRKYELELIRDDDKNSSKVDAFKQGVETKMETSYDV